MRISCLCRPDTSSHPAGGHLHCDDTSRIRESAEEISGRDEPVAGRTLEPDSLISVFLNVRDNRSRVRARHWRPNSGTEKPMLRISRICIVSSQPNKMSTNVPLARTDRAHRVEHSNLKHYGLVVNGCKGVHIIVALETDELCSSRASFTSWPDVER